MRTTEVQKIKELEFRTFMSLNFNEENIEEMKYMLKYFNSQQVMSFVEDFGDDFVTLLAKIRESEKFFGSYPKDENALLNKTFLSYVMKSEKIKNLSSDKIKLLFLIVEESGLNETIENYEVFKNEIFESSQGEKPYSSAKDMFADFLKIKIFSFSNATNMFYEDNPNKMLSNVKKLFLNDISTMLSASEDDREHYEFLSIEDKKTYTKFLKRLNQSEVIIDEFIRLVFKKYVKVLVDYGIKNQYDFNNKEFCLVGLVKLMNSSDEELNDLLSETDLTSIGELLILAIKERDFLNEETILFYNAAQEIFKQEPSRFDGLKLMKGSKEHKNVRISNYFWADIFNQHKMLAHIAKYEPEFVGIFAENLMKELPDNIKYIYKENENMIFGGSENYTFLDSFYDGFMRNVLYTMFDFYKLYQSFESEERKSEFKSTFLKEINKNLNDKLMFFGLFNHCALDFFVLLFSKYEERFGKVDRKVDHFRTENIYKFNGIANEIVMLPEFYIDRKDLQVVIENELLKISNESLSSDFYVLETIEDYLKNLNMNLKDVLINEKYNDKFKGQLLTLKIIEAINKKNSSDLNSLTDFKFKLNINMDFCSVFDSSKKWVNEIKVYSSLVLPKVLEVSVLDFIEAYVLLKETLNYNNHNREDIDSFVDYLWGNIPKEERIPIDLNLHPEFDAIVYKKALKRWKLI